MALELRVWFTEQDVDKANDFRYLTEMGDQLRRRWSDTIEFEVAEVAD